MVVFVVLVALLMIALWQPSDAPQHDKGGDFVMLLVLLVVGVLVAGVFGLLE
jgi:hypothetical protein